MKTRTITFFVLLAAIISLKAQADTSLVLVKNIDSTIVEDVRYATTNNFTGQVLYPSSKVYLRLAAAEKLAEANKYLKENYNYRIKVFDGYRPLHVQKIMWQIMPDDRYVADPKKGSKHNRGAAVDITLIDSTGTQLDMGTPYDNFTKKAHYTYTYLPQKVLDNRKLLHDTMIKFGFEPISTEWWHFDLKGWSRFSILDEPAD